MRDFSLLVQANIFINVIHARLSKTGLPFDKFRLDRLQRTLDFSAINIGDGTHEMWQLPELVRHTAAFEVDN